jgi:hypothetical protein
VGLCKACNNNHACDGRVTCNKCAERNRNYTKEKHNQRRSSNICISCGIKSLDCASKNYCNECLKKRSEAKKSRYYECKDKVFEAYGGYKCNCCGEATKEFLTIDHVEGGGNQHRKSISIDFYVWLVRNQFPSGFQVLCMNCQFGKRFCGQCPHINQYPILFTPDHLG